VIAADETGRFCIKARCGKPSDNQPHPPRYTASRQRLVTAGWRGPLSPGATSFLNASDSRVCRGPLISFASAG
jgi:hypothetical protein